MSSAKNMNAGVAGNNPQTASNKQQGKRVLAAASKKPKTNRTPGSPNTVRQVKTKPTVAKEGKVAKVVVKPTEKSQNSASTTNGNTKQLSKAMKARSKVLGSTGVRTYRKKFYKTTKFSKPRTLRIRDVSPRQRFACHSLPRMDNYSILKYPLNTESAMRQVEKRNTLVFIVDINANKPQIKSAVKELYGIKALKVNTLICPSGKKKAYIRLSPDQEAADVASKVGIL